MPRPLTSKQKKRHWHSMREVFTLRYHETGNGTQSAIDATYAPGSAHVTASRLLKDDKVQARLAELRQKAEDASIATAKERQQVLTEIIRGRLSHFVSDDMTPEMVESAALAEFYSMTITQKDGATMTRHTVKLRDVVKAIDLLNKMTGEYQDTTVNVDARSIIITVSSPEGEGYVKRIMAGEGTGKEKSDG